MLTKALNKGSSLSHQLAISLGHQLTISLGHQLAISFGHQLAFQGKSPSVSPKAEAMGVVPGGAVAPPGPSETE